MGQISSILLLLMTLIAEASLESRLLLLYFYSIPTFQLSFG